MVKRIIIKIAILIAIWGLVGYLYVSSNDMSCDQCTVMFKSSKSMPLQYNMPDLFEESKLKDCPVYWDRVRGYVEK